jgi:hypothetical protein
MSRVSVGIADQGQQALILPRAIRPRFMQPGIEGTAGDLQHPAHRRYAGLMPMFIDERVLYAGWAAKCLAAFFLDVTLLGMCQWR